MRPLLLSAAFAALLLACSPPTQRDADAPQSDLPTRAWSCNAIEPNMNRLVRIEGELAVASAASELRGGSITPGVYDLMRAVRVGQATGWQGERAVVLDVTEEAAGAVTLNWAGAAPGGDTDRWTAALSDAGEQPMLSYLCGRAGTVAVEFTAQENALMLRVPDGANGSLQLEFARRS